MSDLEKMKPEKEVNSAPSSKTTLKTDTSSSSQTQNQTDLLNAKLHIGHDANTEFKERSNILSTGLFTEKKINEENTTTSFQNKSFLEGLLDKIFPNRAAVESKNDLSEIQKTEHIENNSVISELIPHIRSNIDTNDVIVTNNNSFVSGSEKIGVSNVESDVEFDSSKFLNNAFDAENTNTNNIPLVVVTPSDVTGGVVNNDSEGDETESSTTRNRNGLRNLIVSNDPSTPNESTNSNDPSAPTNPTNPSDPSTPTNPTNPSDPGTPTNPANPSDPSTPTNPTNPSDPGTPTNPTNPSDPGTPVSPTTPSDPGSPTNPTNPSDPGTPTNPTNPSDPGTPTNPTDPGNPPVVVLTTPIISITVGIGIENQPLPIAITLDATVGATTTITVGNIPIGATLSAGIHNSDGTWTLTTDQLVNLTLTPPPYFSGPIELDLTATSTLNGSSLDGTASTTIDITGIATTPLLSVTGAIGLEDTAIALNITAALVDTDGSETLSVIVTGVPVGATLSAGVNNGNGVWVLTPQNLIGLTLTPPANFSGDITLQVTAVSTENNDTATVSAQLGVHVEGVADTPILSIQNAIGVENSAIALVINAALVDAAHEALTVTISGVPNGASLSAGIDNHNGTWTLTSAQLTGLQFIPATNTSGDVHLSVTATSSENGTTASVSVPLDIQITGIAIPPILNLVAAIGNEDTAIALSVNASLAAADGESLSIVIGNIPNGAILSAGIDNHNGTWTLTPGQLIGLTIIPPAFFSGEIDLNITAISSENGTTASTSGNLAITVNGVASAPTLSIVAAIGLEDHAIPLVINAALVDNDGSENLSVIVGNVPNGATLSAGIHNSDGTWTLTAQELANLTLTPPEHFSGTINLNIAAVSSENNTTATVNAVLPVTIAGVATTPALAVSAAVGNEDTAIALHINAALADIDGSESLSIVIGNVPNGGVLSAGINNGDGTWTLSAGQLGGLTFTPPLHASGEYDLSVSALSSENGTTASTSATLAINVLGVATIPTLGVTAAIGLENTSIALDIHAALNDNDGSENLAIIIGNVPNGAILSAGVDNHDGTWTLSAGQLTGLTITPPMLYHGIINLNVTAQASENGTTASMTQTLPVNIGNVIGLPSLNIVAATGLEDQAISLNIGAATSDPDATLSITIGNVPNGATLSAGVHNSDGTWTLTAQELGGLSITPPLHYSGDLNLQITATATDGTDVISNIGNLHVAVAGVATTPVLAVLPALGSEDHAIALNINAALVDTDGSENLSIVISNVPTGAVLSAGVDNHNGTWTLSAAQLTGLSITPPENFSGAINLGIAAISSENGTTATASATLPIVITGIADVPSLNVTAAAGLENTSIGLNVLAALTGDHESLSVTIGNVPNGAILSAGIDNHNGTWTLSSTDLVGLTVTPPANYSGNFNLSVTATSTQDGTSASATANLGVSVAGVATTPLLSVNAAIGLEDTAIPLVIHPALVDNDGSETLSVTINNVPTGATLSAGINNGNGTWTLTAAQLTGLTFTPPADFHGHIDLTVTATSLENATTASVNATLGIDVASVADAPILGVHAIVGNEDAAIALNINAALVNPASNESLSVIIGNVPTGATLSAGIHNSDGTWTLTASELAHVSMTPPAFASGLFNLTVTAISETNGTVAQTVATLPVLVNGVANTPSLATSIAVGLENTPIALHINAASIDTDSSENISVNITGVPTGATLSAGIHNSDGSWTLSSGDLAGLKFTPPTFWSGSFNLGVTATASENGTTASATTSLPVTVNGVATLPTLTVQAATGTEDNAVHLNINAALVDNDGSETLGIVVGNIPTGGILSAGTNNGDGTWTLSAGQLAGLTFTPPLHASGLYNLSVAAISSENGTSANVSANLPVLISGVATLPVLSVASIVGAEDLPIALGIHTALVDLDGSESLSVVIAGVPVGATLSAGIHNSDGTWTLSANEVAGVTLTPPSNYSGNFNLSITATSAENGTTASISATLPVMIIGIADAPILNLHAVVGNEDTGIALNIGASLADTDGSENLSIVIGGLPVGATLSAGTHNSDGTWTLTSAQLSGLLLVPSLHASGNFDLTVTAISSEAGTTASVTGTLPVNVIGIATTPLLSVIPSLGNEDNAIALHINSSLVDTDGSETLSVVVGNVPNGGILSTGINNGDGTWTVSAGQLAGLTFTPPEHASGIYNLSITATSSESGTTASAVVALPVTVLGVATLPSLSVSAIVGLEDVSLPLGIHAALLDTDGSENLTVTVSGLPVGATLSAGTHNSDGSWTVSSAQLTGLVFTPPANYSGSFNLAVTATSSENGTTASVNATLPITINGVADAPTLSLHTVTGNEDTPIALNIAAAFTDNDGSENLSVLVAGVPLGASLSAGTDNHNGTWSVSSAQLTGLTFTPPSNYSGLLTLSVTATASENGTTASTTGLLPIVINGVADAPTLSVHAVSGNEDTPIALNIASALADIDGSENLSITIANVPNGATLSAGTDNHNGSWTVSPLQLIGLSLVPPHDFSGNISLNVTATSFENGTTASTSATLPITVNGVADAPTLSLNTVTGNEDTPIALNIAAALTDTDGSETLNVLIAGVPAGATLSAGIDNHNGTWSVSSAQISGLTFTPPSNYSGLVTLSVTATSSENGTTASTTGLLPIVINGVADAPTLSVHAVSGNEDTPIALNISSALTDTDGSESLSITIGGVPTGATLSAGINNGNGSWTLSPLQLVGLTFIPPHDFSGNISLNVTATSSENGTTASTNATLPITVNGVADAPTLSLHTVTGNEDTPISLNITAALTDTDGSESLNVVVAGVPTGATLSAGVDNHNGTWSLSSTQLTGLTFTPPSNYSGLVTLSVTATSNENGTTASTTGLLPVIVNGIADAPTLSVHAVSGNEDTPIALNISSALTDTDGSESLSIVISNVPTGAVLSAGTDNHNGSWTLSPLQLVGLTFVPPHDFSGNISLNVTATSSESGTTASTTATLPITVNGIADAPTLSLHTVTGNEDTAIALNIGAALTDTDGSETLSIVVAGVPTGATLSAGVDNHNGTWSLSSAQLAGLTFTPPSNYSGLVTLSVSATSSENGTTASTSGLLPVVINGVADAPNLVLHTVTGNEDTAIALNINAVLTDTDGSEALSVLISGVPTGAVLSAGTDNHNGSWSLSSAQLTGLTFTAPSNYSGLITLGVTATSSENGTTASTLGILPVIINGVADAPTLSVQSASGNEDMPIALNINSALTDTDGSESLSIAISGVPTGATLSAGINNGNGTWTLLPVQLIGLSLVSPHDFSGNISLNVTATSSENGTTASTSHALSVTVAGVADAPSLSYMPSVANEDTSVALHLAAALTDTDGSETLGIQVSNVPTGATLSAGLNLGNGTWSLTPAQLTGLTMTPPSHYSGVFSLTVTAFSSENGTQAQSIASVPITIVGVASTPLLSVIAASGAEDSHIPLMINSALTDTDGSEILSIVVGNVPTGAILSAGLYIGNNKWSLAPSELTGLTITPPSNFSGSMSLQVSAVSTENNGSHTSLTVPLNVTVTPVADAPTLVVAPALGLEDTAISLNIGAALTDTDGSESLSVKITGVPTGALLSAGTNNGGGSWTLTSAQLTNLKITPPINSSDDFVLTVAATSTESNGTTSTVNTTLPVTVTGVADLPTVSVTNIVGALGAQLSLAISGGLTDTDGSETLTYVVHGIPDGFSLTQGINNGDNTWSLTSSQLASLKLVSPTTFNGQLTLYVTAVSHENDGDVKVSAATPFTARIGDYANGYQVNLGLDVNLGGVGVGVHVGVAPDIDLFPASGGLLVAGGLYVKEDVPKLIADAPAVLGLPILNGLTSFISKIEYHGVPTGVTFSAGTNLGGGVWSFTTAQLNNLYMTTPSNSDVDFTMTVNTKMLGGLADVSLATTVVHVMGVADMPTLSVTAPNGIEDTPVALNIMGALTDTDGSETLSYQVSGLPSGFTLDKGINNGNGTWSLSATDVTNLHVVPQGDFSGAVNLTVSAISTEREGDQTVKQQTVSFNIAAVADAPIITATTVSGHEDQAVSLNLGVALKDTDGSEHISAITISGLPTGATLLNATDNHDGTWQVDPAHANLVQFVPATNMSGDFHLNISATSQESSNGSVATSTASMTVSIDAVADAPVTTATDSTGSAGSAIGLHVGAALTDTDGSEHLSVLISGVPDSMTLSSGMNNGDGSWTLHAEQLMNLSLNPSNSFSGDVNLTVTAISQESSNASFASSHQDFTVHVLPSATVDVTASQVSANGWLSAGTTVDASVVANNNAAVDTSALSTTTTSDHDQVFQNHNTG